MHLRVGVREHIKRTSDYNARRCSEIPKYALTVLVLALGVLVVQFWTFGSEVHISPHVRAAIGSGRETHVIVCRAAVCVVHRRLSWRHRSCTVAVLDDEVNRHLALQTTDVSVTKVVA